MQVNDLVTIINNPSDPNKRYLGSGKIVSIDADQALVVFDHERINCWVNISDLEIIKSKETINSSAKQIAVDIYTSSTPRGFVSLQDRIALDIDREILGLDNNIYHYIINDSIGRVINQPPSSRQRRLENDTHRRIPDRPGGIPAPSSLCAIRPRGQR